MEVPSGTCPFLDLPVELRLDIYNFALLDNPIITIGTAPLVGEHSDVLHRLYGEDRKPFPGIPDGHIPIIQPGYNPSLLSLTHPLVQHVSDSSIQQTDAFSSHSTHQSLLLVNKQIREELTSYFKLQQNRRLSLFLQFPHGLHVCRTLAPHLLHHAQSIHIAGQYVSRTFNARRAAHMISSQDYPTLPGLQEVKYNGDVMPNSTEDLEELISSCFGPRRRHPIKKLEMRIYYPGGDSYSTVWGDDSSPDVVALRNISTAEIGVEIWRNYRGNTGTGVYFSVQPVPDGDPEKRVVSTTWRKLNEGRPGEAPHGSWVVDPAWPAWDTETDVFERANRGLGTAAPG